VAAKAVDSSFAAYLVSGCENHRVQRCAPGDGGVCTTVAGDNLLGSAPNQLYCPTGIAVELAADLSIAAYLIVDSDNYRVQRCALSDGGVCTTVAGGHGHGSAANQLGDYGAGIVVEQAADGSVAAYVFADQDNNRIQRCTPADAGVCTTVAGTGGKGSAANQLDWPSGVAIEQAVDGSVAAYLVVDLGGDRVQRCAPADAGVCTTVAGGNGRGSASNQFTYPYGIALEKAADGSIAAYIVCEKYTFRLQRCALPDGGVCTTVAGGNGQGSAANQLDFPHGVAVEKAADGSVAAYVVADEQNNRVQRCAPADGGSCTTVAGGNGMGSAANQLFLPTFVLTEEAPPPSTTSTATTSTFTSSSTSSSSSSRTLTTSTSSSSTTLPAAECSVDRMVCPVPEEQAAYNYTILGSEDAGGSCSMQASGSSRFFDFGITECNISVVVDAAGERTHYATLVPAVSPGGLELLDLPSILCVCDVAMRAQASATISKVVSADLRKDVEGASAFAPELRLFPNASFAAPLAAGEPMPRTTQFFFEVSTPNAADHVGILNCSTAPTADEHDARARELVDDGCAAGVFGVSVVAASANMLRLSTRAFKFSGTPDVHIRCVAVRCASSPCGSCTSSRRLSQGQPDQGQVAFGTAVLTFQVPTHMGMDVLELGAWDGARQSEVPRGLFLGSTEVGLQATPQAGAQVSILQVALLVLGAWVFGRFTATRSWSMFSRASPPRTGCSGLRKQ